MAALDDQLKATDPARGISDAGLSPVVLAAWERAKSSPPARSPGRRKWRIAVPLLALALVSTGAAIVAPMVPTTMNIGEPGMIVEPDARIPISYTTTSGTEVTCQYLVYLGEDKRTAQDSEVGAILGDTDWTGVGQDVYDRALGNPQGAVDGEVWEDHSQESRDLTAFIHAVQPVVEGRLPADLQGTVDLWRMSSTCEGPYR